MATLEELAGSMHKLGVRLACFTAEGDAIKIEMWPTPEAQPSAVDPFRGMEPAERLMCEKREAEKRAARQKRAEEAVMYAAVEGWPDEGSDDHGNR